MEYNAVGEHIRGEYLKKTLEKMDSDIMRDQFMKTTEHYDRVKHFMKLAGQGTPEHPTEPSLEIRRLRAKLILEEALETIEALGFTIYPDRGFEDSLPLNECTLVENGDFNLVEVIDGCCDTSVVTMGALIACGVPDNPFLEAVDQNNIDKIRNGTIREDGKLIKHPDHKPPRIKEILEGLPLKTKSTFIKEGDIFFFNPEEWDGPNSNGVYTKKQN